MLIISDFLIIVWSYKYIGDLFTLVHHLMAISAYYFVVVRLFYTVYVNRYSTAHSQKKQQPSCGHQWLWYLVPYNRKMYVLQHSTSNDCNITIIVIINY